MRNKTSIVADVLMFILGLFTLLFVNVTVGSILIILSILMFGLYLWLTRRFARIDAASP